jgi:hypothetical protein
VDPDFRLPTSNGGDHFDREGLIDLSDLSGLIDLTGLIGRTRTSSAQCTRHQEMRPQFGQRISRGHGRPGSHSDPTRRPVSAVTPIAVWLRQVRHSTTT